MERDLAAGRKAGKTDGKARMQRVAVTAADFQAALDAQREKTSLVEGLKTYGPGDPWINATARLASVDQGAPGTTVVAPCMGGS